ncbi:MAG: hypothetical protein RMM53_04210, partial [Bacteroidia bacterium]|nr:hypothetical protein [Bacteroidia bacterium]MDW8333401.1 hypothetical protein [Bacteroidia bacterium]
VDGGDEATSFFVFPNTYFITVTLTTAAWVAACYVFPQTDEATLSDFFRRVRPEGFWRPYNNPRRAFLPILKLKAGWILATCAGYALLFCVGKAVLAQWTAAAGYFSIGICGAAAAFWFLRDNQTIR